MENNLNNEDNSNNSNADNVDNKNDNNTTKFRTISDFFLNSFGIVAFISALIYIELYIVACSKSSYYNIPIKYFYSNSEKVNPIIYTVCIFLIILPHFKNLKYKIIEENIVVISRLSTIFSLISLFALLTYTIDKPTNILTTIMFVMGLIIVGLYVKLNKERISIVVCIVIAVILIGICIKEKIDLNLLPVSSFFVLVIWNYDKKNNKKSIDTSINLGGIVKFISIFILIAIFLFLLLHQNKIMAEIAVYGDECEVIENTKENNTTHCEVIITEYNDSFIVMDGTVNDDILTICNRKFKIVDKNDLGGYIRHVYYKDIKVE